MRSVTDEVDTRVRPRAWPPAQVQNQVRDRVWNQVLEPVFDQVLEPVFDQVLEQVRNPVWKEAEEHA